MLNQQQYIYDGDDNLIETINRDRLPGDSATAAGPLGDKSGTGGPASRVSYSASYFDAADRDVADENVGTNGGSVWTRPSTPDARDADHLLTTTSYNAQGLAGTVTDPAGLVSAYTYDLLGRQTHMIANYTDGTPTNSSNQITDYAYDGDNHLISITALLPDGQPSQTTDYIYGVTTDDGSAINSNDLLGEIEYPDPAMGPTAGQPVSTQGEAYTYDALGDQLTYTDRNGTAHTYGYDALGRMTTDAITAFGADIDQTIAKLGFTYDDAGRLFTASSYDGSNNIVNQVEDLYDGLGQVATEYQSHSGAVSTSTTPSIGYTYDVVNGDRLTSEIYPNGRTITYNYDSGLDSTASRISSISDSSGILQSYTYMGFATPVKFSDGNGVELTYLSASMGDAGDNVTGLDRFGRVDDQKWVNSSGTVDEFQYGYDANSNVLYRSNTVLTSHSELYGYDGLNRLTSFERGTLNGSNDGITGTASDTEGWDLDALGNWNSSTVNGITTDRTNNAQNQVTELGSALLGYDANGNTTTDDNGNTLVYDAWNRLVQVKNSSTILATYTFDAGGWRITETHGSTTTDLYFSQSGQVLEEQQAGTATAQYIWSPFYVNGLIERDDAPSGGTFTRRLYVEQDANWNVTSLTDASGSVAERFEYDPYGTQTVLTTSGTTTTDAYGLLVGFQGGRRDPATGLYHFETRDLNTYTGRWDQQDYGGGYVDGLNLYGAEGDHPIQYTDPSGLAGGEEDDRGDVDARNEEIQRDDEINREAEQFKDAPPGYKWVNPPVISGPEGPTGGYPPPELVPIDPTDPETPPLNYPPPPASPPADTGSSTLTPIDLNDPEAWRRMERNIGESLEQRNKPSGQRSTEPCPKDKPGTSPPVKPSDVAGKTPADIDKLAREKGLIPKGPDPMNGKGAYVDPATGEQRILSHPNAEPPHAHVNDPSGNRLDINGNPVSPESPDAHLPIDKR